MSHHPPRIFRPTGSIGQCGSNNPEDIRQLQKMMIEAGYNHIHGNHLRVSGHCDSETSAAIIWHQRLLNMSPSGLVHPQETWFFTMFSEAISPHWRPRHFSGPLRVNEGQLTFDAEGLDYITAAEPFRQPKNMKYFSRILQFPPSVNSGVTLGRGYDMGERSSSEILSDLRQAGIEEYKAVICSKAAYLKHHSAVRFVKEYGPLVGEITYQQQIRLFVIAYRAKKQYAKGVYSRHLQGIESPLSWDKIDIKIRDVYVDSLYQGVLSAGDLGHLIAKGATKNEVINFIETDPYQKHDIARMQARIRSLR